MIFPRIGLKRMASIGGSSPYSRDLFATNGFEQPVANTNESVKYVLDSTGTLVQSPANCPAMPGMRLATTVAEGARLGPELWTGTYTETSFPPNSDAIETGDDIRFISDGTNVYITADGATPVIGKRYQVSVYLKAHTGPDRLTVEYSSPQLILPETPGLFVGECVFTTKVFRFKRMSATGLDSTISKSSISFREVIPTWLPTNLDGTPICPVSRMLRTAQGSVAEYDETYPGLLVEPAATNYLLATATPATQTTGSLAAGTYTLWIEGAGSAAVTAGTATIADNGTASAGSPNTFTVSVAGTVTVTVTDPVTFFQLEGGAFPTSKIPTTTAAVTRAADNVTFATPSWLLSHPNDFAVIGVVIPDAAGQAYGQFCCSYTDANNVFQIYNNATGTSVYFNKRVAATSNVMFVGSVQTVGDPIQFIAYQSSIVGMGLAARKYSSGSWSAWTAWAAQSDAAGKSNAIIASTFRIGSLTSSAGYYFGNRPMTRLLRIPTNLSAAALQSWLIAKAGA